MKNREFIFKKIKEITDLSPSELEEYDIDLVLEVFMSERPTMLVEAANIIKDEIDEENHSYIDSKLSEMLEVDNMEMYNNSLEKKAGAAKEMNIAYDLDDGYRP